MNKKIAVLIFFLAAGFFILPSVIKASTVGWCYAFDNYLYKGSSTNDSNDMLYLLKALIADGDATSFSTRQTFTTEVYAAVVKFQAKYGISATGTVGPKTRAKLNDLYGCDSSNTSSTCVPIWKCGSIDNGEDTTTQLFVSGGMWQTFISNLNWYDSSKMIISCSDSNECGLQSSFVMTASKDIDCIPNYSCSGFGECIKGKQTQTCVDLNSCGIPKGGPALSQLCTDTCTANWACKWGACGSGGTQSQSSVDLNGCSDLIKSSVSCTGKQYCTSTGESEKIISLTETPKLVSPSGLPENYIGSLMSGTRATIKWDYSNLSGSLRVDLVSDPTSLKDQTVKVVNLATRVAVNLKTYTFEVPSTLPSYSFWRIRISSEDDVSIFDGSAATYYIYNENSIPTIPSCVSNWTCGDWGTCSGGTQTRNCTDSNNCTTATNNPVTSQTCQESEDIVVVPEEWCHTFSKYLYKGVVDSEVPYLKKALIADGDATSFTSSYYVSDNSFSSMVESAVIKFQAKYEITQTGTVGPKTRAKLNDLYGCSSSSEDNTEETTEDSCVLMTTKKCVDNSVYWYDSCGNQGSLIQTCASNKKCSGSSCVDQSIACSTDSACGTNGYVGSEYCMDGDVYQNYITYICDSPATFSSACLNITVAKLKTDCSSGKCSNGSCVESVITCSNNSDCGTSKYIGDSFCSGGDVYGTYKTFTCNNAGTTSSYCSSSTTDKLLADCASSQKCSSGVCADKDIECTKSSDCGTDSWVDSAFCKKGDVYREYKRYVCNDAGTYKSYCSSTTSDELVTDCTSDEDCSDGECTSDESKITITSPNGGETLKTGKSYDIEWTSSGINEAYIRVKLYDEDEEEIKTVLILSGISKNSSKYGNYSWTVPSSILSGNDSLKAKIYIMSTPSAGSSTISDYSDDYFTIKKSSSSYDYSSEALASIAAAIQKIAEQISLLAK